MQALKHKTTQYALFFFATLAALGVFFASPRPAVAAGYPLTTFAKDYSAPCESQPLDENNCGIVAYIVTFTQVLAGAVGVVVAIMIVWGGIKYTVSKDNPQETAAAKTIIRNAVIALVFYFFSFAFLQWLIPGGIV